MPTSIRCRSCDERIVLNSRTEDAEELRCPNCGAHVVVRRRGRERDDDYDDRPRPRRRQSGTGTGTKILIGLLVGGLLLVLVCAGAGFGLWRWMAAPTSFPEQTEDYAQARQKFRTKLTRQAAAPQTWDRLELPEDADEIVYKSGALQLKAWVSKPKPNGGRSPAVLFLHGGFAFGEDDWDQAEPFREAGYVVMTPMLRGENGLPGHYSMFYDEVEDVLAAAEALAKRPGVDGQKLYVAGHSVGGTLALLAAMTTNRFRAAASFSGSPDQVKWARGQPNVVPFDLADQREFQMRSPLAFSRSFKCPTRIYYGDEELLFSAASQKTAQQAKAAGLDVEAVSVPGDHMTAVEPAMVKCIEFFRQHP
ncbi:MAG: alpha/beta fold hydrolase [Gemmataceae bacterium]